MVLTTVVLLVIAEGFSTLGDSVISHSWFLVFLRAPKIKVRELQKVLRLP